MGNKYIDREALLDSLEASPAFHHFGMDGFSLLGCVTDLIKKSPSVDAVEVVRCKECKHLKHSQSVLNGELECGYCRLYANYLPSGLTYRGGNDYCSYGERREK